MLRNYLVIAWRNVWRHPGHTTINMLGLAIGLACCVLIVQYVVDEWRYGGFHQKADRIYSSNH